MSEIKKTITYIKGLPEAIDLLQAGIDAEAVSRAGGDTTLQTNIDMLETLLNAMDVAYKAADTVLRQDISTEEGVREAADDFLGAALTAETDERTQDDLDLRDGLDQEILDRIAGDAGTMTQLGVIEGALNTEVSIRTGEVQNLQSNVLQEITDRETGDTVLRDALESEELVRIAAVETVQDALDQEILDREAGDTALQLYVDNAVSNISMDDVNLQASIDAAINDLILEDENFQTSLDAAITERIQNDATLTNDLSVEAAARIAGDAALQTDLGTEETDRIAGDDALLALVTTETQARLTGYNSINDSFITLDAEVATIETVLQDGLDDEEAARIAGDDALQAALDQEILDRIAGDAGDQGGLDDEITARITADNLETSLRTSADDALRGDLDAEITARTQTDTGLQDTVDWETQARIEADDLQDLRIDTEEGAREAGDLLLTDALAGLSGVSDPVTARANLDVLSTAEVQMEINSAGMALGTNFSVPDQPARDALPSGTLTIGDNVFTTDDGDGRWAIYKVTVVTDGAGSTSTFEKIMDEDSYLNAMSASSIKAAYESNADTNAYTDADKAQFGNLSGLLVSEVTRLESSIDQVIDNRAIVDADLYSHIDRLDLRIDTEVAALWSGLDQEILDRIAGDLELKTVQDDLVIRVTALEQQEDERSISLRFDKVLEQTAISSMVYDPVTDDLSEVIYVTGNRIELYYDVDQDLTHVWYFDDDGVTHLFTQALTYDGIKNVTSTQWSEL